VALDDSYLLLQSIIMLSVEELIQEALSLPNATRVFLVEKLMESLESDIDENIQNLWNIEAKKRRDEIRNHTVESIPGEIALSQVRRILEK
jgi:type II secretory pathway component PulL